ncbi:hypothetical protein D3C71_827290 [compost metagenome]
MKRSGSFQMVRIIEGHGRLMTSMPPAPLGRSLPVSSTIAAMMPGSGKVHEPGTSGVAPGSGVMTWPPVSVCQKVSTIGQRSPPMFRWYHIHASGLIGSPTEPRMRRLVRSQFFGCTFSSPSAALMSERIAVGAV